MDQVGLFLMPCALIATVSGVFWEVFLVWRCFQVGGVFTLSVRSSHSHERDVLGTPRGSFFKFGTNVHFNSKMKMEVKGHCDHTEHIVSIFFFLSYFFGLFLPLFNRDS